MRPTFRRAGPPSSSREREERSSPPSSLLTSLLLLTEIKDLSRFGTGSDTDKIGSEEPDLDPARIKMDELLRGLEDPGDFYWSLNALLWRLQKKCRFFIKIFFKVNFLTFLL